MAVIFTSWLTARCGGWSMVICRSQLVTITAQAGLASASRIAPMNVGASFAREAFVFTHDSRAELAPTGSTVRERFIKESR
ncbi:hypothetical protein [Pseudomonas sp. C11]|uniref:hypothetical protein n=1 Tax=Pseudomonas sp. C11 TaxID=3075550 RepID=UPI002AFFA703|nr:hypothetical protein [Pseudomonas sp. C11]